MKIVIYTILLFITSSLFASTKQDRQLLNAIDGICADTWCEGDFEYHFTSCRVYSDSFTVEFTMRKKALNCNLDEHKKTERWDMRIKTSNGAVQCVAMIRPKSAIETQYMSDESYLLLTEAIQWAEDMINATGR